MTKPNFALSYHLKLGIKMKFNLGSTTPTAFELLINEYMNDEEAMKELCSIYDIRYDLRKIILKYCCKVEYQYYIVRAIPDTYSNNWSKSIDSVEKFTPKNNSVSLTAEQINNFNLSCNKGDISLSDRQAFYNKIIDNVNFDEYPSGVSATSIMFCCKQCNFLTRKHLILECFPNLFGLLNKCLEVYGADISNPKIILKMQSRCLIDNGLEDLVWVPESSRK